MRPARAAANSDWPRFLLVAAFSLTRSLARPPARSLARPLARSPARPLARLAPLPWPPERGARAPERTCRPAGWLANKWKKLEMARLLLPRRGRRSFQSGPRALLLAGQAQRAGGRLMTRAGAAEGRRGPTKCDRRRARGERQEAKGEESWRQTWEASWPTRARARPLSSRSGGRGPAPSQIAIARRSLIKLWPRASLRARRDCNHFHLAPAGALHFGRSEAAAAAAAAATKAADTADTLRQRNKAAPVHWATRSNSNWLKAAAFMCHSPGRV